MDQAFSGQTVTEALAELEADGYDGQFVADLNGHVRCLTCNQLTHADEVPVPVIRRVEGESDPADMAAVAALECPHCGTRGTLVLKYGSDTTIEEAEVLTLFERSQRHPQ